VQVPHGSTRHRTSGLIRISKNVGNAVLSAVLPGRAGPSVLKFRALVAFSYALSPFGSGLSPAGGGPTSPLPRSYPLDTAHLAASLRLIRLSPRRNQNLTRRSLEAGRPRGPDADLCPLGGGCVGS
jgi:hypothetical protein